MQSDIEIVSLGRKPFLSAKNERFAKDSLEILDNRFVARANTGEELGVLTVSSVHPRYLQTAADNRSMYVEHRSGKLVSIPRVVCIAIPESAYDPFVVGLQLLERANAQTYQETGEIVHSFPYSLYAQGHSKLEKDVWLSAAVTGRAHCSLDAKCMSFVMFMPH